MNVDMLAIATSAIAIGVSLHSLMEPSNIRNRVREMSAKLQGEAYTSPVQLPFTIDAAWKSLVLGMTFTLLASGVAFGVLWFFRPRADTCLWLIAGILLVKEAINTVQVNAYHSEIGDVIADVPEASGDMNASP